MNGYARQGVSVHAYLPAGFPDLPGAALSEPLEIAAAVTDAEGNFTLSMDAHSPGAPYACYLDHCGSPGVFLRCYDLDWATLAETEPGPVSSLQGITLHLRQTDWTPGTWDWQQAGSLMQQAQIMTLDQLAGELTRLTPTGIFRDWTLQGRMGLLDGLENGLLDPDGLLSQAGFTVRFSLLQHAETRSVMRDEVVWQDWPELTQAFDNAVLRIALTGESRHELENRYRLNLSRTGFDVSNPVQQNIETLQRFFTDSFQSPFDPSAILPPLTVHGLPIINEHTYPGQQHSPFFWQYEEWLERNEPFYAENYFDIRRTFKMYVSDEESKKAIWGRTMPLMQFVSLRLDSNEIRQFNPPVTASPSTYPQEAKIGDQWGRNLVEPQDLVNDAHKDFYAGFYAEAERKYMNLLKTVFQLNILVGRWKGTSLDKYNPATFAAEQRAFKISDPESLAKFEEKYHDSVGYWLSGNVGQSWFTAGSMAKVPYLIEMLLNRLIPACRAALPASLKKSVLISGRAKNPGEVSRFKKDGDVLTLTFRPALAAGNSVEKMRTVTFLALMLSGVEQSPVTASLTSDADGITAFFDLTDGIALSNAGFLAAANGGIPLPLNDLTGLSANQSFTLAIDAAANPGVDFSKMYDVQMVVKYEAQV